jgi:hypothetical protein
VRLCGDASNLRRAAVQAAEYTRRRLLLLVLDI